MTDSKAPKTVKPLKPEILELSASIREGIEIDANTGIIKETRDNFVECMPDGITPESYKAHDQYTDRFFVASANAALEASMDVFIENREIQHATAHFGIGCNKKRDGWDIDVNRDVMYETGEGDNKKSHTVPAAMKTVYTRHSVETGGMKQVHDQVLRLAHERLALADETSEN